MLTLIENYSQVWDWVPTPDGLILQLTTIEHASNNVQLYAQAKLQQLNSELHFLTVIGDLDLYSSLLSRSYS